MVIISYRTIREYADRRKDIEDQLNNWYTISEKSDWANFNEMRQIFNSVDAVGNDLYVFNIKGNGLSLNCPDYISSEDYLYKIHRYSQRI